MKTKRFGTLLVLSLIAVPVFSAGQTDTVDADGPIVMRVTTADPASRPDFPPMVLFNTFIQEVTERSGGRIVVEAYPDRQLGTVETQTTQVIRGVTQGAVLNDGVLGTHFSSLQLYSIPYLFLDREIAWNVLDGPFGRQMQDLMADEVGLRPYWAENGGFRHFSNNVRPIRSPEDMEGLKIRTMNVPLHMQIVQDLGASPTPIPWSELYTSLQTGVVDGQENAVAVFMLPKLEEVQRYMSLDGHVYSVVAFVVNEEWYRSLPEDLQEVVDTSMQIAVDAMREKSVEQELSALDYLAEAGVELYEPTIEEKQMFRELTQASAIEFLREEVGSERVDGLLEAVRIAEQELGYN